jgi:hypothetical protein
LIAIVLIIFANLKNANVNVNSNANNTNDNAHNRTGSQEIKTEREFFKFANRAVHSGRGAGSNCPTTIFTIFRMTLLIILWIFETFLEYRHYCPC